MDGKKEKENVLPQIPLCRSWDVPLYAKQFYSQVCMRDETKFPL
jgi:hypothetical protein